MKKSARSFWCMRFLVLLVPLLISGCFLRNQSSMTRLSDSVNGLSDETRWGRSELAADRVAPSFRVAFNDAHHRWGRDIQIADCDIDRMQLAPDSDSASVVIVISWYDMHTMELNSTRVRQSWKKKGNFFTLQSEEVIEGNAALLPYPPQHEHTARTSDEPA